MPRTSLSHELRAAASGSFIAWRGCEKLPSGGTFPRRSRRLMLPGGEDVDLLDPVPEGAGEARLLLRCGARRLEANLQVRVGQVLDPVEKPAEVLGMDPGREVLRVLTVIAPLDRPVLRVP